MGSLYINKPIDKKRRGKGEEWEFGICRSKLIYKMDKLQDPTTQHRELY